MKSLSGPIYFYIHFITEILCFYFLSLIVGDSWLLWLSPFIYDILAFVPQIFFGALSDRFSKIPFGIIGVLLMELGLGLFTLKIPVLIIVILVALGNACVHVNGAEVTLRSSQGKITPAALFVSGGSFGVITGKLLANSAPILLIFALALTMIPAIIFAERFRKSTASLKNPCKNFNYINKNLSVSLVIFLATLVVSVRGFVGYSIPTAWNKTVLETILLFSFMGIGKFLGGILVDKIGVRKASIISTLGAIPFLVFGNELMIVSLVGVMFFSMTMAITLAIIVSAIPKNPGVAFGFTTVGLALGSLPSFFFKITDFFLNIFLVTFASLICFYILLKITKKEVKNV